MGVFWFEIKQQVKSFFVWVVAIISVLLVFMLLLYPVFEQSTEEILKVIGGFPPEFAAGFGLDLKTIFGFDGFYGFSFGYISLIGAIFAVSLGLSSFAREKRSRCEDFILTKPLSRSAIFMQKLLSGLCLLLVLNIIYITVAMLLGVKFLPALSLFLTQLSFYAAGILFAVFAKKIRSVSGIATAFGFTAFILSALVSIFEEPLLIYTAPLKYFDPVGLTGGSSYDLKYVVTAATVVVFCIVLSCIRFIKSDAKNS